MVQQAQNFRPSLAQCILPEKPGVVSLIGSGGKTSTMFCLARMLKEQGQKILTTTTTKINYPNENESLIVHCTSDPIKWLNANHELIYDHKHITLGKNVLPETKIHGYAPHVISAIYELRLFDWIFVEADGAAGRPLKAPADHEPVIPGSSGTVVTVVGMCAVGRPLASEWVFRPERFAIQAGIAGHHDISLEHLARVLLHPQGPVKFSPPGCLNVLFLNMYAVPECRRLEMKLEMEKLLRQGISRYQRICTGVLS